MRTMIFQLMILASTLTQMRGCEAATYTPTGVASIDGATGKTGVIPFGTVNYVLTSTGTGTVPTWQAPGGGSMVYPAAGMAVSTGSAWTTSKATPSGAVVGTTDSQTLTNKDLSGAGNTFPTFNQDTSGNAATATALQTARNINGVSFDGTAAITVPAAAGTLTGSSLASGVTGSSLTSFGSSPTLVTPILGTPTSGTLTNCTFPTLNQDTTGTAAAANALKSATTTVNVSSATAPTTGQVLTATGASAATWQDPAAPSGVFLIDQTTPQTVSNGTPIFSVGLQTPFVQQRGGTGFAIYNYDTDNDNIYIDGSDTMTIFSPSNPVYFNGASTIAVNTLTAFTGTSVFIGPNCNIDSSTGSINAASGIGGTVNTDHLIAGVDLSTDVINFANAPFKIRGPVFFGSQQDAAHAYSNGSSANSDTPYLGSWDAGNGAQVGVDSSNTDANLRLLGKGAGTVKISQDGGSNYYDALTTNTGLTSSTGVTIDQTVPQTIGGGAPTFNAGLISANGTLQLSNGPSGVNANSDTTALGDWLTSSSGTSLNITDSTRQMIFKSPIIGGNSKITFEALYDNTWEEFYDDDWGYHGRFGINGADGNPAVMSTDGRPIDLTGGDVTMDAGKVFSADILQSATGPGTGTITIKNLSDASAIYISNGAGAGGTSISCDNSTGDQTAISANGVAGSTGISSTNADGTSGALAIGLASFSPSATGTVLLASSGSIALAPTAIAGLVHINLGSVPDYLNNAAASGAGLNVGDVYRITATDALAIVH